MVLGHIFEMPSSADLQLNNMTIERILKLNVCTRLQVSMKIFVRTKQELQLQWRSTCHSKRVPAPGLEDRTCIQVAFFVRDLAWLHGPPDGMASDAMNSLWAAEPSFPKLSPREALWDVTNSSIFHFSHHCETLCRASHWPRVQLQDPEILEAGHWRRLACDGH